MSKIMSELLIREMGHAETAAANHALASALFHALMSSAENIARISALRRYAIGEFAKSVDDNAELRSAGIKSINRVFDLALRTIDTDSDRP